MHFFLQKLPFFLELIFNGSFIVLYTLKQAKKLPLTWNNFLVDEIINYFGMGVPLIIFFVIVTNYMLLRGLNDYLRKYVFSIIVFVPLVITWGDIEFSYWLATAHLFSSILSLYDTKNFLGRKKAFQFNIFKKFSLKPAQIIILTFAGLILAGTLLLMLPLASKTGKPFPFIDAFFMATSATCVTGLTTLSLENNFSVFGQLIILALIQIGGLGIMTLSSSMTIFLGRSLGIKNRIVMKDLLDIKNLEDLIEMIFDIIKYTIIIELWGAIILTMAFSLEGYELGKAIYYGFFHSISAFCNAGFSLFDNSLENFTTNPLVTGTIGILITLGGLGFIVLKEFKVFLTKGISFSRFSIHTKIVLITSFALTFSGTIIIFFGEFLNAIDGYTLWEKIQISLFQSVTLRTAGFNTIPLSGLHGHTIYFMALFMFIGASPGSTGGGIKTSTIAILVQSVKSTLQGKKVVEFFDRTIPGPMVVKTTAVSIIAIFFSTSFTFILMQIESNQDFLAIFFEVISASGTVGLTLGITPILSWAGKLCIITLMYIGRIGPLTLVLAIGSKDRPTGNIQYPDGRLMIG